MVHKLNQKQKTEIINYFLHTLTNKNCNKKFKIHTNKIETSKRIKIKTKNQKTKNIGV